MEVVNSIWLFFQDQILGMKWLNGLIGNGLSQLVVLCQDLVQVKMRFSSS